MKWWKKYKALKNNKKFLYSIIKNYCKKINKKYALFKLKMLNYKIVIYFKFSIMHCIKWK